MKIFGMVDVYVRLIQRGLKTLDAVPEDVREPVEAALAAAEEGEAP